MTDDDTRSILTLSLLAAYADGDKHDRERAEVRRIAEGLGRDAGLDWAALHRDVLGRRVGVEAAAASLSSREARQLAYEMAVCVCDADGAQSPAEAEFLSSLRTTLGLAPAEAADFTRDAQALAALAVPASAPELAAAERGATPAADTPAPSAAPRGAVDEAALDDAILRAAVVNGALELLPETLSTLAIIPLQMKLVYRIGQAHGYELDSGHVKDFLATAGVGLTSQYLEQAGRKVLGGLLRRVGGGLLGGAGRQAVSSGMSFATTYALGHVAKRYYAGGRTLSADDLKASFSGLAEQAQGLRSRYLPQIQDQARGLDAAKVMALVRGA